MCMTLVSAEEIDVKFSDCVDGDTAKFIYNGEEITARFLAIDTPETVHPTKEEEAHGKEASDYTCKRIKESEDIVLEFDDDSDRKDKYGRYLVWVFVDGKLLQEELVSEGLASVTYLYGDYKYTETLEKAEQNAEDNKVGIWDNTSRKEETNEVKETKKTNNQSKSFIEEYKEYIILIGALIMVSAFNLKSKKKVKTKLKNKIQNDIKKRFK